MRSRVHLGLLAATVIFGLNYSIAKVTMTEIPPLALVFFRTLVPALVLQVISFRREGWGWPSRPEFFRLSYLSILGVVINQVFFLGGLYLSNPINAAVLMTTIPVSTIAFALFIGEESFRTRKAIGIGCAFIGSLYLVGVFRFDFSSSVLLGNVMIFVNSLSYGLFLVLARPLLARRATVTFLAWIFTLGAVIVLPICIPEVLRTDFSRVSRAGWMGLGYIILFSTLVAHFLNSWALRNAVPSTVGIYVFLQPVIAIGCSVAFLGDHLTGAQLASGSLVLVGVYLGAYYRPESFPPAKDSTLKAPDFPETLGPGAGEGERRD